MNGKLKIGIIFIMKHSVQNLKLIIIDGNLNFKYNYFLYNFF